MFIQGSGYGTISTGLPYFKSESPAGKDFWSDVEGGRDMNPEDGWVCVFRDFGTPERPQSYPFFILYNKYALFAFR